MKDYNICAKEHRGKIEKSKNTEPQKSSALWLISHLLCLSGKLHIRYITKGHTLNVALDVIKKHRIGKSDWRGENRLLSLDTEIITLLLVTVPRMIKEGKELLLIKHPLCAGRFVSVRSSITSQPVVPINGARKT